MLLRRISHSRDAAEGGIERVLAKAVEALDLASLDPRTKGASSGRIYINFLPVQTNGPFDAAVSSLSRPKSWNSSAVTPQTSSLDRWMKWRSDSASRKSRFTCPSACANYGNVDVWPVAQSRCLQRVS